jgi:hypothetical protein
MSPQHEQTEHQCDWSKALAAEHLLPPRLEHLDGVLGHHYAHDRQRSLGRMVRDCQREKQHAQHLALRARKCDHQNQPPRREFPTVESSETPIRVLVVAHKTAATQPLLDAVRERAQCGPCTFTLLVPNATHGLHKIVDPEDQGSGEANAVIDHALPLLSEAAGSPVEGIVGAPDPGAAVHDAINRYGFDEVIISTLPTRLSRWLKLDLPSKVSGTGLPVTTVTPSDVSAT